MTLPHQDEPVEVVSVFCSGIPSLGRCSRHVQPEEGPEGDPGHAGVFYEHLEEMGREEGGLGLSA